MNKAEARSVIWPWATWCNLDLSKYMMFVSGSFLRYLERVSPIIIHYKLPFFHAYVHTHTHRDLHHGVSFPCVLGAACGLCYSSGHVLVWCKTMPGRMLVMELAWFIKWCRHRLTDNSAKSEDIAVQTSARVHGIRILVFHSVES